MAFPDEPKGAGTPSSESAPEPRGDEKPKQGESPSAGPEAPYTDGSYPERVSYEPVTEQSYPYYDETYSYKDEWSSTGQPGNAIMLTPTSPSARPASFATPTEEASPAVISTEASTDTSSAPA